MRFANNYQIQARQAKDRFLTYDQNALVKKCGMRQDADYLYTRLLGRDYRICKTTGDMACLRDDTWLDANTYNEVMTLLDLICDSSPHRKISGRWQSMESFGLMFHQNLLQGQKDPVAQQFDADPEGLHRACRALGGVALEQGDVAYAIELFEGLRIGLQLWHSDEEFPASLRFLWDENALQYLRYETMYFAVALLKNRILELMKSGK